MRNRARLSAGAGVLSLAGFGIGIVAEDADELSRQATAPTASLMTFNFINDLRASYYDVDDNGYEFRFQPVIPFRVRGTSNILRVGVPFQIDGPGDEGLKSVTLFDLEVLQQNWGRFAVGPVVNMAESSDGSLTKFTLGPAVGATVPVGDKLNLGLFNQNLFGNEVGISQLQPIVAYQLGRGWALSAGDLQFTYDWERGEWVNLPIGFQIGKVTKLGGQAMRFSLNPQWILQDIDGGQQVQSGVHDRDAGAGQVERARRGKAVKSTRTIGFVVLFAVANAMLASPLLAGKEARGRNYTKAEVQDPIRRIEARTDEFQDAVDRDLDRSRIDGSQREDNINEQMKELEAATDRMKEQFDKSADWDQNRNNTHDIVEEARDINDLFSRRPMYSAAKPQWMHLKREVNTLADVYGLRQLR